MYGALIAAGASILGNVLQRNAQEKAFERQQQQLDASRARSTALYNRQYYMDGTQRADTQRALQQARQNLIRANMAAMGRNAVMGGTNASAAAAKEVSSEAYANAVSAAAANAEARKDRVAAQYQSQQMELDKSQMSLDAANDQANAAAIGQAASQVGALAQSAIQAGNAASVVKGGDSRPNVAAGGQADLNSGVVQPNVAAINAPVTMAEANKSMQETGLASKIMNAGTAPISSELTKKVNDFYRDPMKSTRWGSLSF